MEVLLTDEAKSDLLKIPEKIRLKVLKKISYLEDFPEMGVQMENSFKGFRSLLAGQGSYRAIYKITHSKVIIYYVRHTSRQIALRLVRS